MKHITKHNIKYFILFTTILLLPSIFSVNLIVLNNKLDIEYKNYSEQEFSSENELPESSDVFEIDSEYDLSQWWDTRFRYRVAFNVEETDNVDRYQPVDVPLSFEDYEHFEDSARLVSFNATGNDEWSSPIPIQLWDETYYSSGYIEDCMMTFLADVSAGENQTYFLYFNENLDNIGIPSYNTDFSSILASGALTVTVGNLGDLYKTVLEEGKGVPNYIKDGNNYHTDESISPEKQLSHPSLSFLAHMDEGMGNYVNDSTGNVAAGLLMNSPSWVDGVVRKGLDFDSSASQFVNFGGALDGVGEPFHDLSTEFTMTAWINPSDYSHTAASNHGTQNCFIAKASDPYNDNFEVGVNTDGTIHVYIDCDGSGADTQTDFGNAGDVVQGQWNFIVVRFDVSTGLVDVRINDNWYSSSAWSGAVNMDAVVGTLFTIGSTDHINTYFDGMIDEVALYNISLTNQEVENYKYGSETSTIETITELYNGDVFSRYQVDWTESFDMHVSDICTFYYDYNLWNVNRTISFDNEFNGEETNSQMVSLNTYYDLSGVTQSEDFYYIYDGNLVKGLNNDGFTVENYTIIHDPVHQTTKNTLGVFVPNFYASGSAFSEISYLKGTVSYNSGNDMVMYNPGSINDFKNNANPINELHIEFWEFIDHINNTAYSPKLDDAGMAQLFEDTYSSLKNPVNIHLFNKDSKFYNLQVNVTDIDLNLVPNAKITLWNNTDMTEIGTSYTDENGIATFTRLNNGTFVVNATYEMYGQAPLVITTPQIIDLNEGTVDSTGLREISFDDVELTSLDLTLDRFNSTSDYQGPLDGAKVTFWIDDGTGPLLIGSENSDASGNVVFRWSNFTNQVDGNVTFGVEWFGFAGVIDAPGDLDISNILNTTYYFYQGHSAVVNATFGSSFDTELLFTQVPTETEMLGDLINLQVNFTQITNDTIETPLTGADVDYDIKIGAQIINTQTLSFLELGLGVYSLTIDTNNPVEPSGVDWLSSVSYTLEVQASKPGYITQVESISFTLLDRTTSLVAEDTGINAYWNELLVLEVVYTDISFGGNDTIDSASVQYAAIGVPSVVGFLTPYGSDGRYLLEIPTTDFSKSGTYTIQITANEQNYQEKSIFITATIFAIKSAINGSVGIYEDIDTPFRESEIFYFNYTVDSTGEALTGSDIKTYEWTKEIGDVNVDSGAGTLFEIGGGIYSLDFDTETLEIATYTLIFDLEKENYAGRSGIIILHIVERVINVTLPTTDKIISATSGQDLTFDIDLRDLLNNSALLNCDVSLSMQGNTYIFTNNGDGKYSVLISDLPDAFFLPTPIQGTITIDLANYESEEIDLTVNVGMVEIFPGFPMFYFLIIVVGAVAVVGSLVGYRLIQQAKIPKFVKKARAMKKEIKGRKTISDSLLYPSKEEFIVKKLGDKWEMLGLSLENILGLDTKKRKKVPEKSEPKGGAA